MAELNKNDFISKEAIESPIELANNLDKVLKKLVEISETGIKSDAIIKKSKNIKELSSETNKLSDREKELQKISAQIEKERLKQDKSVVKRTVGLKKMKDQTKELQDQESLRQKELKNQIGTEAKLLKSNKELKKERLTLNLETKKGTERLLEINSQISKNQDSLKALSKTYGKQIKEVKELSNEEKELASVNKRLDKAQAQNNEEFKKKSARLKEVQREVRESIKQETRLNSEYEEQSRTLNNLRKRYKDVALTQGSSSREARNLRNQITKLDGRLKAVDASAGQFQRNVGNYRKSFQSAIIGITAFAAGITAIVRGIGRAIKITRDYEDANATLNGILNKTESQTEDLRRQQLALGESTEFSASEVAKAQTELARLGVTQENIIAMTPGILAAATALGTDLASASELVAGQLNAFGLEASKSTEVADVLTKSTQISALNFERLQTALAIVSPAARASGVSIQRTTAILGAAADANIDASTAATALRNIYIDIANKGISFDDAMSQITNSTNRLTAANELFGKRGAVVASVIADQTDKINTNTEALENAAGAAQAFADKQLDTLTGRLKLLNSAWEGFVLSIENGNGTIGLFINNFITGLTNLIGKVKELNTSVEELKNNLKLEAEAEVASNAIKTLTKRFEELQKAGSNITLEELGNKTINNLVQKVQDLNNEYFVNSERLDYINRLIDNNNTDKLTAAMIAERDELEKSIPKYATKIKLLNSAISAIQGHINKTKEDATEQEKSNTAAEEGNQIIKRTEIFLRRILSTSEKIEELKPWYQVLFGETMAESEKAAKDAHQDFLDRVSSEINAIADKYNKEREEARKTAEEIKRLEAQKKQNYIDAAWSGIDSINNLFARQQQATEQELRLLQESTDYKLSLAEGNEEAQQLIREKAADRERQLQKELAEERRKQAIFNKSVALADIAINTASAITEYIGGLPFTAPLIVSASILGAAQAAAVLSQPIPSFAEGVFKLNGEGTETSDSIRANLSKNESVVPAKKTHEFGNILKPMIEKPDFNYQDLVNMIIAEQIPKFAGNLFSKGGNSGSKSKEELNELREIKRAIKGNRNYTAMLDGRPITENVNKRNGIRAKIERRNRF